jgi:NADH-quinone oxidoreductase subunit N
MSFEAVLNEFLKETATKSLGLFFPELLVCATVLLLLLARLFDWDKVVHAKWVALGGVGLATALSLSQLAGLLHGGPPIATTYFSGLMVLDPLAGLGRAILLGSTLLTIVLTVVGGIPDRDDGPDFYTLLLGSLVGLMLMVGANHLLMLFLGIEMASVPSYALAGFFKGRKTGSEAALKFAVFGAASAGAMLFGISLLSAITGTGEFGLLAERLTQSIGHEPFTTAEPLARCVLLAIVLIIVGFAFKLSVFPFHFWCPDVFEGAAAEVAAYLSVASKAASVLLLVRWLAAIVPGEVGPSSGVLIVVGQLLGIAAAITCTFGNLAAFGQQNLKRLMGYSAIAQAGYLLMPVSVLVAGQARGLNALASGEQAALEGLQYYLVVYVFMNLAMFAAIVALRNQLRSENLADWRGLGRQSPRLAASLALALFSLVGLPPLGGFFGKLAIFSGLVQGANHEPVLWLVLGAGILNTVLSLFYYINILRVMILEERPADPNVGTVRLPVESWLLIASSAGVTLLLGVWVEPLARLARMVAVSFQH